MKVCWNGNVVRLGSVCSRAMVHTKIQGNFPDDRQKVKTSNLYKREFLEIVKSRINRSKDNRTMSMRNKPLVRANLSRKEELDRLEIPNVDCIVGILSNSQKASPKTQTTTVSSYQGHREMSKNQDKKFKTLADHSYYTETDAVPVPCQYTKELETRTNSAEDKLLKFPVDNESIVWEESHVQFTDHIFLHKYIALFPLETRRFMETIVSALQNNPDLTAEKKKLIIWSYLNYFKFNSSLLQEDEEDILEV